MAVFCHLLSLVLYSSSAPSQIFAEGSPQVVLKREQEDLCPAECAYAVLLKLAANLTHVSEFV